MFKPTIRMGSRAKLSNQQTPNGDTAKAKMAMPW